MNFENRWVLRSALNFASDGEVVREVGREFQRKGPEKADLAKECLTRVKKKREDDRKPGRLAVTKYKSLITNLTSYDDNTAIEFVRNEEMLWTQYWVKMNSQPKTATRFVQFQSLSDNSQPVVNIVHHACFSSNGRTFIFYPEAVKNVDALQNE
ncbi:hypothetical protein HELRODRAFT_178626 [Helobdella robusta]|uniref:Uncharacterized protein n=1 Tax=Helobdella robusta TaxID=6412 RepID=T1FDG9_HELRO|nr:hypothetical protein HELRODRAFT_178626 [Helobdella robusta]ESN96829.1 hypothetical protein HELRODRAFT_178626 [Helobdella robusta]